MNAGLTSERVYEGLRQRILDREFRPGDRLDPSALAEVLNSSVTPVRDALHNLTGAGLVETRTSEGFHLPHIDEPGLQDLYAWNAEILSLALRSRRAADEPAGCRSKLDDLLAAAGGDAAAASAELFARIAERSSNIEHHRAVRSANDRLHAARLAESRVLAGIEEELADLCEAAGEGAAAKLRKLITAYHRRRRRAAAEIVRSLYRDEVRP
ncbi:GntR family transcriptional regulator [Allosphingosinicella sp.]|uniref:GntR family transcriptional regulator n=1 Tax=Allosphingosinicella sp. TaxID=2823234 RepID=UPI002FC12DDD